MLLNDPIEIANAKALSQFQKDYLPPSSLWFTYYHPKTQTPYSLTLHSSTTLSSSDLLSCFNLIETTSGEAYHNSKDGWKPRAKKAEMKLLDLKYVLVSGGDGEVEGFMSFMPTYEDEIRVLYCYEIHLDEELQGSGLGTYLINLLHQIASRIPGTEKVMLTCFTSNVRGLAFYQKLGYSKDEFSPSPKILRNGTKIEKDYMILSKAVER